VEIPAILLRTSLFVDFLAVLNFLNKLSNSDSWIPCAFDLLNCISWCWDIIMKWNELRHRSQFSLFFAIFLLSVNCWFAFTLIRRKLIHQFFIFHVKYTFINFMMILQIFIFKRYKYIFKSKWFTNMQHRWFKMIHLCWLLIELIKNLKMFWTKFWNL
jgi:hypothetical protein